MRPHRRQPTRLPRPWDSQGKNTGVGCHFLLQCMKVKSEREVAQSYPTLSDPMDCSLQAPPSMGFSRQVYWSGVPLPSLNYLARGVLNYLARGVLNLALSSGSLFKLNLMFFSCHHHFKILLYLLDPQDVLGSYYFPLFPDIALQSFFQETLVPFRR